LSYSLGTGNDKIGHFYTNPLEILLFYALSMVYGLVQLWLWLLSGTIAILLASLDAFVWCVLSIRFLFLRLGLLHANNALL